MVIRIPLTPCGLLLSTPISGCAVTFASNGKLALECLKTRAYDVWMCDFLMPVMSGVDAKVAFHQARHAEGAPAYPDHSVRGGWGVPVWVFYGRSTAQFPP